MESDSQKKVLAVFDFDGTLTYCDSLLPFLRSIAGRTYFCGRILRLVPVLVRLRTGMITQHCAKEMFLKEFVSGRSVEEINRKAAEFAAAGLCRLCNPAAVERMQWHQEQGHRVILLSASPAVYLQPWAELQKLDQVLGTELEVEDRKFTGRIAGQNCRGPEKMLRLRAYLEDHPAEEIFAYADGRSDKEVLAFADHAFYRGFGNDTAQFKLRASRLIAGELLF